MWFSESHHIDHGSPSADSRCEDQQTRLKMSAGFSSQGRAKSRVFRGATARKSTQLNLALPWLENPVSHAEALDKLYEAYNIDKTLRQNSAGRKESILAP